MPTLQQTQQNWSECIHDVLKSTFGEPALLHATASSLAAVRAALI